MKLLYELKRFDWRLSTSFMFSFWANMNQLTWRMTHLSCLFFLLVSLLVDWSSYIKTTIKLHEALLIYWSIYRIFKKTSFHDNISPAKYKMTLIIHFRSFVPLQFDSLASDCLLQSCLPTLQWSFLFFSIHLNIFVTIVDELVNKCLRRFWDKLILLHWSTRRNKGIFINMEDRWWSSYFIWNQLNS